LGSAERESVMIYKTDDWEVTVDIMRKIGWGMASQIMSRSRCNNARFIQTTLNADLLEKIDKACKGIVVEPTPEPQLKCDWIRTEDGKFHHVDDPIIEFKKTLEELEKTLKGGKEDGILR